MLSFEFTMDTSQMSGEEDKVRNQWREIMQPSRVDSEIVINISDSISDCQCTLYNNAKTNYVDKVSR